MDNIKGTTGALLFLLSLLFCYHAYTRFESRLANDFYQFWMISDQVSKGQGIQIYNASKQAKMALKYYGEAKRKKMSLHHENAAAYATKWLYPTASPFFYATLATFNTGVFDFDYANFRLISFVFYILGIVFICRYFKLGALPTFLFILLFTMWFSPFLRDMRRGNINQIQIGLIAFYFWLSSQNKFKYLNFALGFFLAVLLIFKANVILAVSFLFLSWLLHKQFRKFIEASIGFLGGLLFVLAYTHLYFRDIYIWMDWYRYFPTFSMSKSFYHRFSIFIDPSAVTSIFVVTVVVVVSALIFLKLLLPRIKHLLQAPATQYPYSDFFFFNFGLCLTLLLFPIVHSHYFVLTVPTAIYLLRPPNRKEWKDRFGLCIRQYWGMVGFFFIASFRIATHFGFQSDGNITKLTYIGVLIFICFMAGEYFKSYLKYSNETLNKKFELIRFSVIPVTVGIVLIAGHFLGKNHGLVGEYYEGKNFEKLYKTRVDKRIKFNWRTWAPFWNMDRDEFSVRWTGKIGIFGQPGLWGFQVNCNDGVRLWIDNQLVIDDWVNKTGNRTGEIYLEGGDHDIKLEYFENVGKANINLKWRIPDGQKFYTITEIHLKPN